MMIEASVVILLYRYFCALPQNTTHSVDGNYLVFENVKNVLNTVKNTVKTCKKGPEPGTIVYTKQDIIIAEWKNNTLKLLNVVNSSGNSIYASTTGTGAGAGAGPGVTMIKDGDYMEIAMTNPVMTGFLVALISSPFVYNPGTDYLLIDAYEECDMKLLRDLIARVCMSPSVGIKDDNGSISLYDTQTKHEFAWVHVNGDMVSAIVPTEGQHVPHNWKPEYLDYAMILDECSGKGHWITCKNHCSMDYYPMSDVTTCQQYNVCSTKTDDPHINKLIDKYLTKECRHISSPVKATCDISVYGSLKGITYLTIKRYIFPYTEDAKAKKQAKMSR